VIIRRFLHDLYSLFLILGDLPSRSLRLFFAAFAVKSFFNREER